MRTSAASLCIIFAVLSLQPACAFLNSGWRYGSPIWKTTMLSSSDSVEVQIEVEEQMKQTRSLEAAKFKILTCTSTTCAKKRASLNLDEYATFGGFYSRIEENNSQVQVEESPCLGSCKLAPCVAVEHEDFVGTVALLGMTQSEFSAKCFHSIVTEEDADRVWSCVESAIGLMVEEAEGQDDSEC